MQSINSGEVNTNIFGEEISAKKKPLNKVVQTKHSINSSKATANIFKTRSWAKKKQISEHIEVMQMMIGLYKMNPDCPPDFLATAYKRLDELQSPVKAEGEDKDTKTE